MKQITLKSIADLIINHVSFRDPDFIIGGSDRPYLLRWWLIPRNRIFNIYLHCFLRSDDDRALHDHPWANCSILLRGNYIEHTIAAGGIHQRKRLFAGDFKLRLSGRIAHRLELVDDTCWTIFITGPTYRRWGFHCPERGWVYWKDFTNPRDIGSIGRGCDG